MIPKTILSRLASLARREYFLRVAWGMARVVVVAFVLLSLACLTDWLIDRTQDTPWPIRVSMLVLQVSTWGLVGFFLVIFPLMRRFSLSELALWVEREHPRLRHRLISAVQLNDKGSDTRGMSKELISCVTLEAERETVQLPIQKVADHRRLKWAAYCIAPVVLLAGLFVLLWPQHVGALLARQVLLDHPIPRSVALRDITDPKIQPKNEPVQLRIAVQGKYTKDDVGTVRLHWDGETKIDKKLTFERWTFTAKRGKEAVFVANVPAHDRDFQFQAYLHDGRLREPGHIQYVARPVVGKVTTWLQLPESCGLRPDGSRYEQLQPDSEIRAIPNSGAKVVAQTQKPVKSAVLQLLRYAPPNRSKIARSASTLLGAFATAIPLWKGAATLEAYLNTTRMPPPKIVAKQVAMSISKDGKTLVGAANLDPQITDYQIEVRDKYGYTNKDRKRRAIAHIPEEPPQVTLLPEYFPPAKLVPGATVNADYQVEGMPVPAGAPIRIVYRCYGHYGLGAARLMHRVLKPRESSEDELPPIPFQELVLDEVKGSKETGPFDPRRGVFQNSGPKDQVRFHAVPSDVPSLFLGRKIGGGRFEFQTQNLKDADGNPIQQGDQIEFYIEVLAGEPGDDRPSAKSQPRVKSVVSLDQFVTWLEDTLDEQRRVQEIGELQRNVFRGNK